MYKELEKYFANLQREIQIEKSISILQIVRKIPCLLEKADLCAASISTENFFHQELQPKLPQNCGLDNLRLCFSVDEKKQTYLDFLYEPLPKLQKCIQKVEIGNFTFGLKKIDSEGSLCIGKLSNFSQRDFQSLWLEIDFSKV